MIKEKNFDFSFSGLKTAVIDIVHSRDFIASARGSNKVSSTKTIKDLCASFQQAVVDVLVEKTIRAAKKYKVKTVMISGGVSANKLLRHTLKRKVKQELLNTKYCIPNTKHCIDNGAMVACAAYFQAKRKDFDSWKTLQADANLKLK